MVKNHEVRTPIAILIAVVMCPAMLLFLSASPKAAKPTQPTGGLLPDLRTVVPAHLNLVNEHQREILRFSNGIANTGAGPWAMRPDPPPSEATTVVSAVQEFRDSGALYKCGEQPKQVTECYNVVSEKVAGTFEFHPAHNHWHIGDVALFEVRKGSPTGPIVGNNSIKTTFCLIDWYKLDGNAPASQRTSSSTATPASRASLQAGWISITRRPSVSRSTSPVSPWPTTTTWCRPLTTRAPSRSLI